MDAQGWLLTLSVAVVGVLHTSVPDHWAPITLIARQRGWSRSETALAAAQAGTGHVLTTLVIGLLIWIAGASAATHIGNVIDTIASFALIAFGGWIALSSWRDIRGGGHGHSHGPGGHHHHHHDNGRGHAHDHSDDPEDDRFYVRMRGGAFATHVHVHRHGKGLPHIHWHDHDPATAHVVGASVAANPPLHIHTHRMSGRTALLLILGSSPMIEGLPAFLAASRLGVTTILIMSIAFALSTIATYVVLCVVSVEGMQRVRLGPLERYGEVISGVFIALVGVVIWVWPLI
jgi:ABC-type nickel/cobalt efflux system permease component RcnA